jgi:hypothetical protein
MKLVGDLLQEVEAQNLNEILSHDKIEFEDERVIGCIIRYLPWTVTPHKEIE